MPKVEPTDHHGTIGEVHHAANPDIGRIPLGPHDCPRRSTGAEASGTACPVGVVERGFLPSLLRFGRRVPPGQSLLLAGRHKRAGDWGLRHWRPARSYSPATHRRLHPTACALGP